MNKNIQLQVSHSSSSSLCISLHTFSHIIFHLCAASDTRLKRSGIGSERAPCKTLESGTKKGE